MKWEYIININGFNFHEVHIINVSAINMQSLIPKTAVVYLYSM